MNERPAEPRAFEEAKAIDLQDPEAVRFWSERLKASPEEIVHAVQQVGANSTAVEIYLGAP